VRILHIITTLAHGGAQSVLMQLLEGWEDRSDQQMVISLMGRAQLSAKIEALKIPVDHIRLHPGKLQPIKLLKLIRIIRTYKPDVIQTWLYHSDLLGSIAARLAGNMPIVWGVHHTTTDWKSVGLSTWIVVRLLSRLSTYVPSIIVCCSQSTFQEHVALGYPREKMAVIPNGIDINRFRPNKSARTLLRKELSLSNNTKLIGMFARYHPQKDHLTFLQAAGILVKLNPNVHYVLAGEGVDISNNDMRAQISEQGLEDNIHLLGSRNDIPLLAAGIDIATLSSSFGEALPQVIGEAMACGIPCVATNIGDTAVLVGNGGIIVQPKDPQDLADAWQSILELSNEQYRRLSNLACERIVEFYNSRDMIREYKSIYRMFKDVSK
jgi:glycosyltransferase involved in cell wall biosynthesis